MRQYIWLAFRIQALDLVLARAMWKYEQHATQLLCDDLERQSKLSDSRWGSLNQSVTERRQMHAFAVSILSFVLVKVRGSVCLMSARERPARLVLPIATPAFASPSELHVDAFACAQVCCACPLPLPSSVLVMLARECPCQ